MAPTRCLLVDDHPVVVRGLAVLLRSADDLELVGDVASGEEAADAVAALRPEIVLIDLRLPGIDGIAAMRLISSAVSGVRYVVLSAYADKRVLSDALAAGADGYVLKGSPPEDLLRAIRTVAGGRAFVDPSLSPMLVMADGDAGTNGTLSEREREILLLLGEGLHTGEIARRIGLSAETVKSDTRRAIERLGASTRTHAVAIALRRALID
ncbi:MAG: response regulator transcription factor [Actinomycetota bacterium]|nr:response regulator transcription factor [Actinomycetota bacterium]